jgi:hypothetical protein
LDPTPKLPHPIPIALDIGLGFDDINWTKSITSEPSTDESPVTPEKFSSNAHGPCTRAEGRRSISFTSPRSSPQSLIGSPARSTFDSPYGSIGTGSAYQAALGNALIAASHAESAKGTHNDLLQILNHDNHPWGFSYSAYPHRVRVWYGDKDEKIAENAVRWMERVMGADKCHVKVVKGADHGLMYKSSVVVEVLERVGQNGWSLIWNFVGLPPKLSLYRPLISGDPFHELFHISSLQFSLLTFIHHSRRSIHSLYFKPQDEHTTHLLHSPLV